MELAVLAPPVPGEEVAAQQGSTAPPAQAFWRVSSTAHRLLLHVANKNAKQQTKAEKHKVIGNDICQP